MKTKFDSNNSVEIIPEIGERLYFRRAYHRAGALHERFRPAFWNQCMVGRILHGCYFLRDSGSIIGDGCITLTGSSFTGMFYELPLAEGQKAFVSLGSLAGFCVNDARRLNGSKPVMSPVISGLFRPVFWAMGHPIPCVFEGPATVILYGAALRMDEGQSAINYKPEQVVAFDACKPFGVNAMGAGPNLASQLYNALTLESLFDSLNDWVLVEDFIKQEQYGFHFLRHFIFHIIFAILLALIFWLNR